MTRVRWVWLGAAGAGLVLLCAGGAAVLVLLAVTGGQGTPEPAPAGGCGSSVLVSTPRPGVGVAGFTAAQVRNATTIVQVGQQMGVPPRGWVVAVATSMQESNLVNDLRQLDHDSIGLFQQRVSIYGSETAGDPAKSARAFYERLLKVAGWAGLPLTVAAQRVQISAFPDAYAKHEARAAALVGAVTGGADKAATTVGQCAPAGVVNAGGWVAPVAGGVISGFRTPERPNHEGDDLEAAKRTAVHVAAAGTVIKAICDPATAATRGSCDVDGSSETLGCGWYVDVAHADGVMTRYCHMIERPLVVAGQQLAAGQQIGWSGTSGNSSGPHVHFEVHINGDRTRNGATDPVPFMRAHGAPLGGA